MNDTLERGDDPVSAWLQDLAAGQLPIDPAHAEVIWWRAQALRRIDQQRRLTARLELGEYIQLGCAALAAMILLLHWLEAMPQVFSSGALAAACIALVGGALALTIWEGASRAVVALEPY
jgi:hypothetical protein